MQRVVKQTRRDVNERIYIKPPAIEHPVQNDKSITEQLASVITGRQIC